PRFAGKEGKYMRTTLAAVSLALALALGAAGTLAAEDAPSPDDAAVTKALDSRKVTLNFPGTPLAEAFLFIQDITGLNIAIDPAVETTETTITLRVKDITLRNAVEIIVTQAGGQRGPD